MKKATQKNFLDVLAKISKDFQDGDKDEKKIWINWLNKNLDELRDEDFFGTEGQCDPRGDNRN